MHMLVKIRNRISLPVGHALIGRRKDDQYLASYPRSGSTWLRTMLVNIIVRDANSNPDVFNAVIPGVSITQVPRLRALPSPRIIHTHTYYRPEIKRVVYTLRDGRDVLVSFYHYLVTRRGVRMSFAEWFKRYMSREYGHRWEENIRSWLVDARENLGDDMLIVHFEEMKARPVQTLEAICGHLGIEAGHDRIESSIDLASLENARKIEKERASGNVKGDGLFYRGGKTGQWKEYFDSEINKIFWEVNGECMRLSGYADET